MSNIYLTAIIVPGIGWLMFLFMSKSPTVYLIVPIVCVILTQAFLHNAFFSATTVLDPKKWQEATPPALDNVEDAQKLLPVIYGIPYCVLVFSNESTIELLKPQNRDATGKLFLFVCCVLFRECPSFELKIIITS